MDPEDPSIVYAQSQEGNLSRLDLRTGRSVNIRPRPQNTTGVDVPPAPANPPAGGQGGGRGGFQRFGRWHWDAPLIISPHSSRRLYWATNFVYRSDDRGDTWTRISPDLSRNLNRDEIPIMGKLWPADSIARNTSTTPLSNVVAIDESPLIAR